jgi:D-serine deaminase-like pyridoxal phosphate-dependent protein
MTPASDRLSQARQLIGSDRSDIPTPALILDRPLVEQNVQEMARRMAGLPAALRPHAKIHKSPVLGRLQLEAGAIGLTTATIWEASAMADAGLDDLLIANQVVGPVKAAELARVAGLTTVTAAVDSTASIAELAAAGSRAGTEIGVIIEVDVGLHRSGVRSAAEAVELGRQASGASGVQLRGLLGYEGHCMLEPDRAVRIEKAHAANAILVAAADDFDAAGLCTDIVAGGGLGTWDITGANPRITELHAGSYIFSDAFHRNLVPGFEPALTVLTTVISRSADTAVLDCGRKSIGIDRTPPEVMGGAASIRFEHGEYFIHEEHTVLDLPAGSELAVGDRVELMPGYSPTTVNLYDVYFVARDGIIIDVWPICARYGADTVGIGPAR